jgi:hypothetical protein
MKKLSPLRHDDKSPLRSDSISNTIVETIVVDPIFEKYGRKRASSGRAVFRNVPNQFLNSSLHSKVTVSVTTVLLP